jgi:molecular chaperone GrpE
MESVLELPQEDVAKLADELQDANDRILRVQAELENYRKRARRELDEQRRYAALPLVADLLAVVDNLERAIEASDQGQDGEGLREGVKMVASLLQNVLEKHDCRQIEAIGHTFDPHVHEALAQESSMEHEAGTVSRVTRVGYCLHDRVVRPSQVFVSTGPPQTETAPSPPETEGDNES